MVTQSRYLTDKVNIGPLGNKNVIQGVSKVFFLALNQIFPIEEIGKINIVEGWTRNLKET